MKKLRLYALVVSLMILVTAVSASCGESPEADAPVTTAADSADAVAEAETTEDNSNTGIIMRQMADMDLEGREFRILGNDSADALTGVVSNEIFYEEEVGEPLQDAVYTRNHRAEDLLNIRIKPTFVDNTASTISKSVMAGDDEYDTAITSLMNLGAPARKGYFRNFYKISTMDLSQPWWDQNLVGSFTLFGNRLYFINGDINYRDDYSECVNFFNKKLVSDFGFDNPYDLVDSGTWTIDAMMAMADAFTRDLNGDGKLSIKEDAIGYGDNGDLIKHLIYAMGEKITENDEDGIPRVAQMTETHINKVQKLTTGWQAIPTFISATTTRWPRRLSKAVSCSITSVSEPTPSSAIWRTISGSFRSRNTTRRRRDTARIYRTDGTAHTSSRSQIPTAIPPESSWRPWQPFRLIPYARRFTTCCST